MRPLYDARIEDLGDGDLVSVECACGHSLAIPSIGLQQGMRLPLTLRVLDLKGRFRCRECDQRGKVAVSIGGLRVEKGAKECAERPRESEARRRRPPQVAPGQRS